MDTFRLILCQICKNTIDNTSSTFTTPCGHVVSHQHCLIQQLQRSPNCPVCKRESSLEKIIGLNLIFGEEISADSSSKILIKKLVDKNDALNATLTSLQAVGCVCKLNSQVSDINNTSCDGSTQNSSDFRIQTPSTSSGIKENEDNGDTGEAAGKQVSINDFLQPLKSEEAISLRSQGTLPTQTAKDYQLRNRTKCKDSGISDKNSSEGDDVTSSRCTEFSKLNLVSNLKTNSATESHACEFCKKTFTLKAQLVAHRKKHGVKPYKCNICKSKFARKSVLAIHVRVHTGEKPYACEICCKSFTQKSSLYFHKRKIHVGENHTIKHNKVDTAKEKLYSCDVCFKAFSLKQTLNVHKKIHTGEKPYSCDVCGKEFSAKQSLDVHNRIHTGERPYLCVVCGAAFTQKNNLKRHGKVHSEMKRNLQQSSLTES